MPIYIIKASWRSTALLLKVEARDEDAALAKAAKLKEVNGCMEMKVIRHVEGT